VILFCLTAFCGITLGDWITSGLPHTKAENHSKTIIEKIFFKMSGFKSGQKRVAGGSDVSDEMIIVSSVDELKNLEGGKITIR
jgi:hypothetical protein